MSNYKGFTTVQLSRPERSLFDLSHEKRLSMDMGELIPILVQETIPNDTFRNQTEMLIRLAPTLAPFMHRINAFVHYFFVPNRLLWSEWEDFITAGRLGDQEPEPPNFSAFVAGGELGLLSIGTLADYMGINPDIIPGEESFTLDAMPFAAYYKIWYDYYRDRNFIADDERLPLPSGTIDLNADAEILRKRERAYQHDYFTSALPFTQRGAEVLMPLSGVGSVTYLDKSDVRTQAGGTVSSNLNFSANAASELTYNSAEVRIENIDEVTLDASTVSINDFRQANRLQQWLERNALAGSRYNESIMAHFGRKTSDARLQRAEYLGGGKVTIKVNEVVNTAWSTDADSNPVPAGTMSGHAIAYTDKPSFTYNCEEHGFIIGILSVLPVTAYMQGLPRMFKRPTFLDYPWPSFAHLGEQPVYDYEIYSDAAAMTPDVDGNYPVFGYQSRYADWKHTLSSAHGDFRNTLDFWHLTRKFATAPTLGAEFIYMEKQDADRIFSVQTGNKLWIYLYNNLTVKRALPYYGTPRL